jgi:hypothetical protein
MRPNTGVASVCCDPWSNSEAAPLSPPAVSIDYSTVNLIRVTIVGNLAGAGSIRAAVVAEILFFLAKAVGTDGSSFYARVSNATTVSCHVRR